MSNPYSQEQRQLSRESLRTALFELMKKRSYADITISELCKKAGISRMAFYRNYESKDAVFLDYFDEYTKPFYAFLNGLSTKEPSFISQAYLQYVDEHSEIFEVAIQSGAEYVLAPRFSYFVSQFYLANVKSIPFTGDYAKYWNSFICAGLYNMTIDWIKDGKTASRALLAEIIRKIGG